MSVSHVSHSRQSEVFTHFFPPQSRKNETIQQFIKTLLPFLNQQWCLNTDRILCKIRSFKDQMRTETYEKCLSATRNYLNSRDFEVSGRYEIKKSWFFSGIQYHGETPRFQQLNSGLKALLKEVETPKASWSKNFRACWNGFIDGCSSAVSYAFNNPGKTVCSFLALETAALAVRSYRSTVSDASTSIVPLADSAESRWNCGSNLFFGLSGTLLTQDPFYVAAAGLSCMPMAYSQIVNGQIPDQLLNIGDPFLLDINMTELFGEPVTDVMVSQAEGSVLPEWLKAGPMVVGNLPTTNALGVAIKDNLAYVADGDGGLKIVDVRKASQPVLRGSLVTSGATKVAIQKNIAYVAAGSEGLKIIDVSDSAHPIFKSSLKTSFARGIAVSDHLAYVASGSEGLKIIDVSNSTHPSLISSLATVSALAVTATDHFAYIADDVGGLKIVDVSNPIHPTLISTSPTYVAQGVTVGGNNAYVADYSFGLRIIDVSRADKPVLRSTLRTTDALEIAMYDNSVYMADGGGGLKIIDTRNVSSPVLKGSLATTFANGIAVDENYGYIADSTGGLKIIDLSSVWEISGMPIVSKQKYDLLISAKNSLLKTVNKRFIVSTDYFPTALSSMISQSVMPGSALTLLLDVDNLFQDKDDDTLILNMSLKNSTNPLPSFLQLKEKPFIGGYLATSGAVRKVVYRNNFAYLADGVGGFKVVDVSDRTHPILKSVIAAYQEAMDVAIQGNYAYLADNGFKIIDISDPTLPVLKSSLSTGGFYGIIVNGNFAYCVGGVVQIIDISDASHPVLKGKITMTSAKNAVVQGSYAYVVDTAGALRIFDVADYTHPVLKSSFATTLPNSVAVDRDRAYVAGSDGLIILNVQNVSAPVLISRFKETLYDSRCSVTAIGNRAYIADSIGGGLKIIDVSDPVHPHLETKIVTTSAQAVSVRGNYVYIADFTGGLKIADLSNYQFIVQPTHDEGNYELIMTATDPELASASTSFVLRVEGAPRLMKPLPAQVALVGQPFSCFVPEGTFWDPNNDIITYSTQSLVSFLTFNPSSATLWGVPSGSDRGEHNITLLATDRITPPTSASWHILVHYPPMLNQAIPTQVADIGHPFIFTLNPHTFSDKDEHYSLTYSATLDNLDPLPSWFSFNNQTQTFSGTPQEADKGTLNVLVKVDDGLQGQATASFPLTIEHFPLLAKNFSAIYAAIGHSFTLNAFSYFLNGDDLIFSATSKGEFPANLNFDSDNCRLFGTFQPSDKGVIPFTLMASDVNGGSVSADLNITVDDYAKVISSSNPPEVTIENRSPQLVEPLLQQTFTADVDNAFSVRNSFADQDGDELTFSADYGEASNWLTMDAKTAQFSGTPSSYDAATFSIRRYTVGVTAMDPANKTAAGSFDILLEGPSFIQKILTALGWISGFAVASYGYYQKKHLVWNWCRKGKYRQPDLDVSVGQKGVTYKVDYPWNEIKYIVVTEIKNGCCIKSDSCCLDICKNTMGREFTGGAAIDLFDWLSYNPKTNMFYIEGPSEQYRGENIKIQIVGTDKRIREQVTIKIGNQDDTSDLPFEIPLKDRQPVATFSMSALSSSSSSSVSSRGSLNATKTHDVNSMKISFLEAPEVW